MIRSIPVSLSFKVIVPRSMESFLESISRMDISE
jgi:hypothetical protein